MKAFDCFLEDQRRVMIDFLRGGNRTFSSVNDTSFRSSAISIATEDAFDNDKSVQHERYMYRSKNKNEILKSSIASEESLYANNYFLVRLNYI